MRSISTGSHDTRVTMLGETDSRYSGAPAAVSHIGLTAQSLKGTIVLPAGESLTIRSKDRDLLTIGGGGLFTLRFDNDCHDGKTGPNDMFVYYENTIVPLRDGKVVQEQFIVGDLGETVANTGPMDGGPDLAGGKPCMSGQISETENLP